ncbi:Twitching mobility protein [Paenibacillus allorhizoplanae]|jgi:twitching motility protein PilT|uniref:Twitching mobility protein n=1 Tax=Paenibacillus allorhizoplanae TaxID=2905648 RepID=A0ABM9BY30_9BACL|nr:MULTISPECIES: type IV pilus twitching motility protein PilT [Paenibacillus]CAH1197039.1 Twitching mobility protein [Paenibacillus allorhizoplanae]
MSMSSPTTSDTLSLKDLLRVSYESKASDLHINATTEPLMRLHGKLMKVVDSVLSPEDTHRMAKEILTKEQYETLSKKGEVDFSFELPGLSRYRGNVFKQKRHINMVFRVLSTTVPSLFSLNLPDLVQEFAHKHQGLVLVTGPTGSGKSTTLASIIDFINETQKKHIITLEDPIEYIHPSKNCLVAQREIGIDTLTFSNGLRAALRQDPDVILVGEMRDLETIKTAITAAETGHLVLATLHTPDAPQTVDRIIDVFPTEQQRQIRVQLASVLISVLSQRLVPRMDGRGRAMALEILINTPAVANLIRQEKIYQIKSVIQTNRQIGMQTMVSSLKQLVEEGIIHRDAIKEYEMTLGED